MAAIYQYVTEPGSGLQCVICLDVAEDPWQHGQCGRLFCFECLRRYGGDKPCPNCRRESPQYFEDNKSKRDIHALMVKCSNAECGDTMERRELKRHFRIMCPHTVIRCKYKGIGCDTELKRGDMAAHEQDDKLHLHMALETLNLERRTLKKKNDASMTCAMPDFDNRRRSNTIFFSTSFYVNPRGYHMSLVVDANGYGDGEGTHVSVFAPILEGEYDAELKWPFVGEVTYTLLNQLEDSNHHTITQSIDATQNAQVSDRWGILAFIPHSALAHDPFKNTQYLKDDTLYFRVSVEVAEYKPWLECTTKI